MPTIYRFVLPARTTRTVALTSSVLLTGALLAACGASSAATGPASASASAAAATSTAAAGVVLKDAWVKSAPNGMTALFGTFTNPTARDITVVSGTTSAASKIELHEVVMVDGAMKMRPKTGGFLVRAHGTHELKPGGDHLMMMGLTAPIKAGDTVTATLSLNDGSTVAITAIGKDFAGGNENYQSSGSAGMTMSPGMTMPASSAASMAASASTSS
ncbi:MAG TPA: copper chaperone PCu(A)C [Kineosporiaceae bacterium]|nr:copper chaperone PCu(A)C [Kineosporiaceae bacterium]